MKTAVRLSHDFNAWYRTAYEASLSLLSFSCQNLLRTSRMYQWLRSSIMNSFSALTAMWTSSFSMLPVTSCFRCSALDTSHLSSGRSLLQSLRTVHCAGLNLSKFMYNVANEKTFQATWRSFAATSAAFQENLKSSQTVACRVYNLNASRPYFPMTSSG